MPFQTHWESWSRRRLALWAPTLILSSEFPECLSVHAVDDSPTTCSVPGTEHAERLVTDETAPCPSRGQTPNTGERHLEGTRTTV